VNFFEAANAWIAGNQALVVSVGIPVFTLVVTAWASFLSHGSKAAEVKLNGHLKLSEYRRTNYDELLRLSARLQTLFVEAFAKSKLHGKKPADEDTVALLEVIGCGNLLLLRSNATQQQAEHFSEILQTCTDEIFHLSGEVDVERNALGELRVVCKTILDDEWSRIERELKVLAP
jgi:hypothetical protein